MADEAQINAQFEKFVDAFAERHGCERHFYSKVVGATHPNPDGTSRARIIGKCEIFEPLELQPEPENKFDANAMAVLRFGSKEQLGYLDARLAAEVADDTRKRGQCWVPIFRHVNRLPETREIVGANIYLSRMPDDDVARKEDGGP